MDKRADESPLWPIALAFGLVVVIAIVVVIGVVSAQGEEEPEPGPVSPLDIVRLREHGDRAVRVVTSAGGCEVPVSASVTLAEDLVTVRVVGRSARGGCAAVLQIRCNEVALPEPIGGRRLVGVPRAADVAGRMPPGPCPRLR